MAIAALPDVDGSGRDELELPWPKPVLRLVPSVNLLPEPPLPAETLPALERLSVARPCTEGTGGTQRRAVPIGVEAVRAAGTGPRAACPSLRRDAEGSTRRRARASRRVVRRRVAAGALVAGLLVLLALPITALGGAPLPSHSAPAAGATAGDTVYVVQPGDTLWSIADRVDPNDPRALVRELTAQTGSALVHPGERLDVP